MVPALEGETDCLEAASLWVTEPRDGAMAMRHILFFRGATSVSPVETRGVGSTGAVEVFPPASRREAGDLGAIGDLSGRLEGVAVPQAIRRARPASSPSQTEARRGGVVPHGRYSQG